MTLYLARTKVLDKAFFFWHSVAYHSSCCGFTSKKKKTRRLKAAKEQGGESLAGVTTSHGKKAPPQVAPLDRSLGRVAGAPYQGAQGMTLATTAYKITLNSRYHEIRTPLCSTSTYKTIIKSRCHTHWAQFFQGSVHLGPAFDDTG